VLRDIGQFDCFAAILAFDVKIVVDIEEGPGHGLHCAIATLRA
jgi:hypothetical protein